MSAIAARHSSVTSEHYSPAAIVEAARATMGGIDLDPASCEVANATVRAMRIFTRAHDGLSRPWNAARVFLNPPGGRDEAGSVQRQWWRHLAREWSAGRVEQAVFVCFSVELLQVAQADLATAPTPLTPLDFPLCFPRARVAYSRAIEALGAPLLGEPAATLSVEPGDSPPHASCIVYLPPRLDTAAAIETFRTHFAPFGRCINLTSNTTDTTRLRAGA